MLLLQRKEGAQGLLRKLFGPRTFSLGLAFRKKFVDPQDVDFAIQDLLKGRRIGAYQDLAEGGEQFLSRSRVHTPPGKGKQRIVHALCSLNEATVLLIACSSFEEASQAS
jgi:hypothetical protein